MPIGHNEQAASYFSRLPGFTAGAMPSVITEERQLRIPSRLFGHWSHGAIVRGVQFVLDFSQFFSSRKQRAEITRLRGGKKK
jgi:hypothetical protein